MAMQSVRAAAASAAGPSEAHARASTFRSAAVAYLDRAAACESAIAMPAHFGDLELAARRLLDELPHVRGTSHRLPGDLRNAAVEASAARAAPNLLAFMDRQAATLAFARPAAASLRADLAAATSLGRKRRGSED